MSIFDALTDPGTDALLGLTQGFGQAAMPQRMPTPWGAVLGMGAGGALQGVQQGQALRHAGIQNQQAQMGLDWYKQMMNPQGGGGAAFGAPAAGGGGTDINGNYIVSPKMLASMIPMQVAMGKDPSGIAKLLESYSGGAGYALTSAGRGFAVPGGAADPSTVGTKAAAAAYGTGSGEAPFKAPITIDVPDGQGGFRKQTMTPQQGNQFLNGQDASTAPAGAIPASQWAQRLIGTEGVPGNPAAKNPLSSATGDGQFIGSTWLDQVRKQYPDQTAGKSDADLLALRKDPILSHQMTMAYGAENGGTLAKAGLPVNATTLAVAHKLGPQDGAKVLSVARSDPATPLSSILSPAVIQANPQFANQTAGRYVFGLSSKFGAAPVDFGRGAPVSTMTPVQGNQNAPGVPGMPELTPQQKSALDVQTAWMKPNPIRQGGMLPVPPGVSATMPGGGVLKNPELREITLPNGEKQFIHINPASPYAPEGTPGSASGINMEGPNTNPKTLVGSAVAPDTQAARTHLVEAFHGKDQDAYTAAQNTQGWLNQIDHAADVVNKAGAVYQTGPFAKTRLGLMGKINDVGRSVGINAPFNENALASAEELRKATTTAGFELSSHYEGHAKQAASTIQNATSAVPGYENSPQGVRLVSAGIREGAQSAIDSHEYRQQRYNGVDPYGINPAANGKTAGAGLETAETDFYKKFTPEMYSTRAISTVQPPKMAAKSQADFEAQAQKYLPGTQVILNGQPKIIPARPDAPLIPPYIQQRLMQAPH